MNLTLFIVVLGGRSRKSNIEIHDVRWVIGETLEDTFPELKKQWLGNINGLHIDSYISIKYIDGYKIVISESTKNNSVKQKERERELLWFVNLGGYNPKKMYEEHEFTLVVAKKAIDAKKKAKRDWKSHLKDKHHDNLSGIKEFDIVDDIHCINRIKKWKIELIHDTEKRSQKLTPDWYGYMRIDKY